MVSCIHRCGKAERQYEAQQKKVSCLVADRSRKTEKGDQGQDAPPRTLPLWPYSSI